MATASVDRRALMHEDETTTTERTRVQLVAGAVGAVFLLVGILGFVPGVVKNFDDLSFASHHSGAELLGIFQVSVLHNIVHLLFGVAGLALARKGERAATLFLLVGGLVYIVLAVYGAAIENGTSALNFVPVNEADSYLHLGLGSLMIAAGVVVTKGRDFRELG
jgi:hypothetical protein